MTPAPLAIRTALVAMALLIALVLLSGGMLGVAMVVIAYSDPALGGDPSLAISAGVATLTVWGASALVMAAIAVGVWSRSGAARWAASALALVTLVTPFGLLGVVMLWGLWGDEEGRRWMSAA
jgi:hypothetical protein